MDSTTRRRAFASSRDTDTTTRRKAFASSRDTVHGTANLQNTVVESVCCTIDNPEVMKALASVRNVSVIYRKHSDGSMTLIVRPQRTPYYRSAPSKVSKEMPAYDAVPSSIPFSDAQYRRSTALASALSSSTKDMQSWLAEDSTTTPMSEHTNVPTTDMDSEEDDDDDSILTEPML